VAPSQGYGDVLPTPKRADSYPTVQSAIRFENRRLIVADVACSRVDEREEVCAVLDGDSMHLGQRG